MSYCFSRTESDPKGVSINYEYAVTEENKKIFFTFGNGNLDQRVKVFFSISATGIFGPKGEIVKKKGYTLHRLVHHVII